jgi:hypothetical protein
MHLSQRQPTKSEGRPGFQAGFLVGKRPCSSAQYFLGAIHKLYDFAQWRPLAFTVAKRAIRFSGNISRILFPDVLKFQISSSLSFNLSLVSQSYLQVKMAVTVVVRATYTEERALADFFTQTFGTGSCTILVSGRSLLAVEFYISDGVDRSGNEDGFNAPSLES